ARPRVARSARGSGSAARVGRVVSDLHDELAEVPPAQEPDERLWRVLEPDDDVLPVADPAFAEPLGAVTVEVGEAVAVVGDDEAADERPVHEERREGRPGWA